jgi:20S proteasome alpha/beta subunit
MSLVVAIKDKDRIVLGADKQASLGGTKDHTNIKIWRVEELPGAIMGSVGSARAAQIIQYSNIIDKNLIGNSIDTEFIIKFLVPTIAGCLKANGILIDATSNNTTCDILPNLFIFAYADRAWFIWHDLSVTEIVDYTAIGSGADIARGVLFATKEKNPFERIVTCIDAAAETSLYVDDGIDLLATQVLEEDGDQIAQALGFEITKPKKKKSSKVVDKNN